MNESFAPREITRRRLGNYLLDARLQLKAAVLTLAAIIPVALLLGIFLWRTSRQLLEEAQAAVEARSQAAQTSRELGVAALSNQLLEHFNDQGFSAKLRELSKDLDARYDHERDAVMTQHEALKRQRVAMNLALVGALTALIVLLALFSIVATHKVAGPVFRLKSMMRQVCNGPLHGSSHLRKGDELQELFSEFARMLERIRGTQRSASRTLDQIIERAKAAQVPRDLVEPMEALSASLRVRPIPLDQDPGAQEAPP